MCRAASSGMTSASRAKASTCVAAAPGDTRVRLRDWSLERQAAGYHAQIAGRRLRAGPALRAHPAGAAARPAGPVAQGPAARTGQLLLQPAAARGRAAALSLQGRRFEVTGKAWLDHEWSEELLHPRGRGLGLDRHEPGRRQRPHGLSPARARTARRCGTAARSARPAAPCTPSAPAKWCSARSAAGPARCRRPPTRSSGSCARRPTSTPCRP